MTFAEIKAHQDQLLNGPDFSPEFDPLLDGISLMALDIRTLFSSTSKRAFVANNPSIFGMGRLFEAYHRMTKFPSQVHVFYDLPSAL